MSSTDRHHAPRSRSPSRAPPTRSRSRSPQETPDPPTPPTPNVVPRPLPPLQPLGGCPHTTHCSSCVPSLRHPALKPSERSHGWCGLPQCCTLDPAYDAVVLQPIPLRARDASPGSWRWTGYLLAFRYLVGIGRWRVHVPHYTCVLQSVRDFVDAEQLRASPPELACAAQEEAQDPERQGHQARPQACCTCACAGASTSTTRAVTRARS